MVLVVTSPDRLPPLVPCFVYAARPHPHTTLGHCGFVHSTLGGGGSSAMSLHMQLDTHSLTHTHAHLRTRSHTHEILLNRVTLSTHLGSHCASSWRRRKQRSQASHLKNLAHHQHGTGILSTSIVRMIFGRTKMTQETTRHSAVRLRQSSPEIHGKTRIDGLWKRHSCKRAFREGYLTGSRNGSKSDAEVGPF